MSELEKLAAAVIDATPAHADLCEMLRQEASRAAADAARWRHVRDKMKYRRQSWVFPDVAPVTYAETFTGAVDRYRQEQGS